MAIKRLKYSAIKFARLLLSRLQKNNIMLDKNRLFLSIVVDPNVKSFIRFTARHLGTPEIIIELDVKNIYPKKRNFMIVKFSEFFFKELCICP